MAGLVDALDDALPQTQCTRCGYPDCRRYAQAIAAGEAEINQCPPGGAEGIARLAAITGRAVSPMNPANGVETPRRLAVIDEAWCIGCTLCLKACPADAIVGGPKGMHTVIASQCTGCELCLPPCPVDCIALVPASGPRTGWQAWSAPQASEARERYGWHVRRLQRDAPTRNEPQAAADKHSVVAAAVARARAGRTA
jgi:electron transport complex protein RnfB